MKETGLAHWESPTEATNSSGFRGRPRVSHERWTSVSVGCNWWSSTVNDTTKRLVLGRIPNSASSDHTKPRLPVRCLRD
jgi:hypothetical protein